MGSHAVYGADGVYRMESFEAMRPTVVGMYRMCWCRETAERNCTVNGDFSVSAGNFVYRGPNIRAVMDPYELGGGWGTFKVTAAGPNSERSTVSFFVDAPASGDYHMTASSIC